MIWAVARRDGFADGLQPCCLHGIVTVVVIAFAVAFAFAFAVAVAFAYAFAYAFAFAVAFAVAFNPVDRAVSPGPEADKVRRLFERSAA
ncbi:hypothetical protein [Noviherbaspirillum pedocola]|uniref:Uncharacterized protein n=1 Tax=Noviherbaspirillum pedocola TaxID=2801341 RepID=A0A934W8T3_9BURK|nr:hypothetical protein [Noviherbaspirillum pedocola]MBK4739032.1 hypothetical protein [Noviherbaspirillum pedocola]